MGMGLISKNSPIGALMGGDKMPSLPPAPSQDDAAKAALKKDMERRRKIAEFGKSSTILAGGDKPSGKTLLGE